MTEADSLPDRKGKRCASYAEVRVEIRAAVDQLNLQVIAQPLWSSKGASSLSDPRRECGPSPLYDRVQVSKVRLVL